MSAATSVTRFIHSRWMLFTSITLAICAWLSRITLFPAAGTTAMSGGTLFPALESWIPSAGAPYVNLALFLCVVFAMAALNRTFSLSREASLLAASTLCIMSCGTPQVLAMLCGSTSMCLVIIGCSWILFSQYANIGNNRPIFLIFFILSSFCTVQYAYAFYIPVFMAGCLQMRIMTVRMAVAAVLGLLTPWWILLGCAFVIPGMPQTVQLPPIAWTMPANNALAVGAGIAIVTLVALLCWVLNFPRMIAFNARRRAMNGFIAVLTLATPLLAVADIAQVTLYAVPMFMLGGYQVGQLFGARRPGSGWLGILLVYSIFAMMYIANMVE